MMHNVNNIEHATDHLLALQQPVGPEFTSANGASVRRHLETIVTAMWLTARNTILFIWKVLSSPFETLAAD
jgi:hypothetical protein